MRPFKLTVVVGAVLLSMSARLPAETFPFNSAPPAPAQTTWDYPPPNTENTWQNNPPATTPSAPRYVPNPWASYAQPAYYPPVANNAQRPPQRSQQQTYSAPYYAGSIPPQNYPRPPASDYGQREQHQTYPQATTPVQPYYQPYPQATYPPVPQNNYAQQNTQRTNAYEPPVYAPQYGASSAPVSPPLRHAPAYAANAQTYAPPPYPQAAPPAYQQAAPPQARAWTNAYADSAAEQRLNQRLERHAVPLTYPPAQQPTQRHTYNHYGRPPQASAPRAYAPPPAELREAPIPKERTYDNPVNPLTQPPLSATFHPAPIPSNTRHSNTDTQALPPSITAHQETVVTQRPQPGTGEYQLKEVLGPAPGDPMIFHAREPDVERPKPGTGEFRVKELLGPAPGDPTAYRVQTPETLAKPLPQKTVSPNPVLVPQAALATANTIQPTLTPPLTTP